MDINSAPRASLAQPMEPDTGKDSRRNASLASVARKDILGRLRRGCVWQDPEGGVPIWQRWRASGVAAAESSQLHGDATVAAKRNVEGP